MFNDFKEKKLLTRYIINANRMILRKFVNLIECLNFKSLEIIVLKKYFHAKDVRNSLENFKSLFITNNVEIKKK